jgi:TolB-like protein/class 3 adenylate cyclase
MTSTRQLAAIMFTDIVGYTALMGKDEPKAMGLVRKNREVQKPLIEKYNGSLLKEMGDGNLASFPTASDAIYCAREIQQALHSDKELNLRIGIHLGEIRIEGGDIYGDGVNVASRLEAIAEPGGIYISDTVQKSIRSQPDIQTAYLGELELKNVDYAVKTYAIRGEGLPRPKKTAEKHLSGRLMAELQRRNVFRAGLAYLAFAFIVYSLLQLIALSPTVTSIVYVLLIFGVPASIYLAWNFERSPEGFVRVTSRKAWLNPYSDNQKKPFTGNVVIIILLIIIVVIVGYTGGLNKNVSASSGHEQVNENSIAVLYFDNMSGDPGQEYFSDGMTEEIIAQVSMIRGLDVRSRTSVLQYKVKREEMNLKEIAEELGVNTILEGSIRKSGNKIRVTAQLIDADTDEHLWTEQFDEDFEDIFAVQSNIARKIAEKFNITITESVEMQLETPPTLNMEAYDLFLKARQMSFDEWGFGKPQPRRDSAAIILKKVIEMDPVFSDAYSLLSRIFFINTLRVEPRKEWLDSIVILAQAAITYNPDNPYSYLVLGDYYNYKKNNPQVAIGWYLKANSIDPSLGLDAIGDLHYNIGEFAEAYKYFFQNIKKNPQEIDGYVDIAALWWDLGILDSANKYANKARDMSPQSYYQNGRHIEYYIINKEYEKAIEFGKRRWANDTITQNYEMGKVFLFKRDFKTALKYYLNSDYRDLDFGLILWKVGLKDSAISVLNKSIDYRMTFEDNFFMWHAYDISRAYATLGEPADFSKYARLSFDLGWHSKPFFDADPLLDSIRNTPEFKEVAKEFNQKNDRLIKEVLNAAALPDENL